MRKQKVPKNGKQTERPRSEIEQECRIQGNILGLRYMTLTEWNNRPPLRDEDLDGIVNKLTQDRIC